MDSVSDTKYAPVTASGDLRDPPEAARALIVQADPKTGTDEPADPLAALASSEALTTASLRPKSSMTSPRRFPSPCARSVFRPHIRQDSGGSRSAANTPRTRSPVFDSGNSGAGADRADCALTVAGEYGMDLNHGGWDGQGSFLSSSTPVQSWHGGAKAHNSVLETGRELAGYGFYFGAKEAPYPKDRCDNEDQNDDTGPGERGRGACEGRAGYQTIDTCQTEQGSGCGSFGRRTRFHSNVRRSAESWRRSPESSLAPRNTQSFVKPAALCGCLRYATAWRKSSWLPRNRASGTASRKDGRPRKLRQLRCENIAPFLGPQRDEHKRRTTLVLDLDETLVHSSFRPVSVSAFVITVEVEGTPHNIHVCKRPGVDKFLEVVSRLYEVVIFTASLQTYADPLIDLLDPKGLCPYRLFRSSCSHWKGLWIKDLENLGRDLRRVILVDNSPSAYLLHPWNALPIKSWFFDMEDRELFDLTSILVVMATVEDVPAVLKETVGPSCRERVLQELRLLGEVEDERDEKEWFRGTLCSRDCVYCANFVLKGVSPTLKNRNHSRFLVLGHDPLMTKKREQQLEAAAVSARGD